MAELVAEFSFLLEMDSEGECFSRTQNKNMPADMIMSQLRVLLRDYCEEYYRKYSAKKP